MVTKRKVKTDRGGKRQNACERACGRASARAACVSVCLCVGLWSNQWLVRLFVSVSPICASVCLICVLVTEAYTTINPNNCVCVEGKQGSPVLLVGWGRCKRGGRGRRGGRMGVRRRRWGVSHSFRQRRRLSFISSLTQTTKRLREGFFSLFFFHQVQYPFLYAHLFIVAQVENCRTLCGII